MIARRLFVALGTAALLAASPAAAQDKSLTVAQAQQAADASNGKALGANLLFGVGGAAVAGGALMFVFSMPEPGMKAQGAK